MKKVLSVVLAIPLLMSGMAWSADRRSHRAYTQSQRQNVVKYDTYATGNVQCEERSCKGTLPRTRRYCCPRQDQPGCCFSSYGTPSRYGVGNAWNPYPGWGYFRKDTYGTNFNF